MTNPSYSRTITLVLLVIAAFAPVPYGFYQFLRIFTCGTAVYLAYQAFTKDLKAVAWGAVILAIVFNPLLALHFIKEQWIVLNLVGAVFLGVTLLPRYRSRI